MNYDETAGELKRMPPTKEEPFLIGFECHPVSSRFCWIMRSLGSTLSPEIIVRFDLQTRQAQFALVPSVTGKANVWIECGSFDFLGLHSIERQDRVAAVMLAWQVPAKQIASVIEHHSGSWSDALRFAMHTSFIIITSFTSAISTATNAMEDDDEDAMIAASMATTSPSSNRCEYRFDGCELVKHPEDLAEFRIARPELYCEASAALLSGLCEEIGFVKSSMAKWLQVKLTRSLPFDHNSTLDEDDGSEEMRLELDAWSSTDHSTHFSSVHSVSRRRPLSDDPNSIRRGSGARSARCAVLAEPWMRSLGFLRAIRESPPLTALNASSIILSIYDEQALVMYVHLADSEDAIGDENGEAEGANSLRMTLYIAAHAVN